MVDARRWFAIVWIVCGPTAAEIKTAREATPHEVYEIAEQETASSYPLGERMPDELVFATVPQWFTDNGRQQRASGDDEQKKAGNMQISFAVLVTADGAGAKVLVTPSAIDYLPDKPEPRQLDDAALPKWLTVRADKLRVTINKQVQAKLASRAPKK